MTYLQYYLDVNLSVKHEVKILSVNHLKGVVIIPRNNIKKYMTNFNDQVINFTTACGVKLKRY